MRASDAMTDWDASERLAARIGEPAGDLSSGHERWRIYQRAMDMPQAWADLLAAIASDPDRGVAAGVAVPLLERVPPEMRDAVVATLADGNGHDYAVVRSRELGILESLADGRYDVGNVHEGLDSWSNWLQLRAAGKVTDERVLAELASSGRTKRIRSTASRRLRLPAFGASFPASKAGAPAARPSSGERCR